MLYLQKRYNPVSLHPHYTFVILPGPITNTALLATLVQLIGISFQSILREEVNQRRLTILGITLLMSFVTSKICD